MPDEFNERFGRRGELPDETQWPPRIETERLIREMLSRFEDRFKGEVERIVAERIAAFAQGSRQRWRNIGIDACVDPFERGEAEKRVEGLLQFVSEEKERSAANKGRLQRTIEKSTPWFVGVVAFVGMLYGLFSHISLNIR